MSMTVAENFHWPDEVALAQLARLTDWIWDGAPVVEFTGTVAALFPQIPVFSRHPFRIGGDENRYKDEIRREPLKITEEPVPIATVSKTYSLLLSEYGERMHWSCPIPNAEFDPGDGNPIVVRN